LTEPNDQGPSPTETRSFKSPDASGVGSWPSKGFVTLKQILGRYGGPIPCGPTRWWEGVKIGEFPKPLKVAGRTVWRVGDIDELITRLEQQNTK
jgi:prophage regulatory protein